MSKIQPKMNIQSLLEYQTSIPDYQRAYSWEEKQCKQFWSDLIEHLEHSISSESTPYFIGHILFEKEPSSQFSYYIIDGQQRITTTIILLSVIEKLLAQENITCSPLPLTNFSTVSYDNSNFRNQIIEFTPPHNTQKITREKRYETASIRNCIKAYDYFFEELAKNRDKLQPVYTLLLHTEFTTQVVEDKLDAIKRFVFENNRGKAVNKLELFKSLCMYQLYLNNNKQKIEISNQLFKDINHYSSTTFSITQKYRLTLERIYNLLSSVRSIAYSSYVITLLYFQKNQSFNR